ncbi:MAG TPA: protein kinase [Burkholderiales bacterium]|jgi:serine/threonine protein kinase
MPDTTYRNALPLQSMLLEYRLEAVLGAGGFGMTYLGRDTHLEKHVAIKEYLPTDLVVRALDGSIVPITGELKGEFDWGLERFILEARTLAKFSHPHIVRVIRFFQANATGYMVMDYEKGESLHQMLKRGERPDEARLKGIVMPLLDGLQAVHATGFLHRDIKPSNIFVRESGSPVLIDFGAARHAIGATRSLTSVLTPGYAPLEQYSSDGHQGPWSDIYAMAGVLFRALVNENPPDAVSRMKGDTLPAKLALARGRVSEPFLRAVEWALALDEKQRPQSVQEWQRALAGQAGARDTTRMALQSTPTFISAPPPPIAPPAPVARAPTRPASGKSGSGWRWVGIAAVVLVLVVAFSAWNRQRPARTVVPEAARPAPAVASPSFEAAAPEPKPAVEQQFPDPGDATRDRPERARADRPGDKQRPGLEEFRRKVFQEFRSGDRDDDGYLSREEVRSRFPGMEREYGRVDGDGDGRISPEEFLRLRRFQAQQRLKKQ